MEKSQTKSRFQEDFFAFVNDIESRNNFAFTRYSDGELFILQNKEVTLDQGVTKTGDTLHPIQYDKEDFKTFLPGVHEAHRDELERSLAFSSVGYYKGICCPCCTFEADVKFLMDIGGNGANTTFANLFVNSNYPLFVEHMIPALRTRKVVIICNENANVDGLPFDVVRDFRVGYNCFVNDNSVIWDIMKWIEKENIVDHVFLFSAASLSEVAIWKLWEHRPFDNTFMDIGTCLNFYMDLSIKRDYLQAYWSGRPHRDLEKVCRLA